MATGWLADLRNAAVIRKGRHAMADDEIEIVGISSTRGWERFEILANAIPVAGWDDLVGTLRLTTRYWDRSQAGFDSVVSDSLLLLPQVLLTRSGLGGLLRSLQKWETSGGLDQVDVSGGEQSLLISEGKTEMIMQPWQKLLEIRYSAGTHTSISQKLVVDGSVLDAAISSLESFLAQH